MIRAERCTVTTQNPFTFDIQYQAKFYYQGRRYSRSISRDVVMVLNPANSTIHVFRALQRHVHVFDGGNGYSHSHYRRNTEQLFIARDPFG